MEQRKSNKLKAIVADYPPKNRRVPIIQGTAKGRLWAWYLLVAYAFAFTLGVYVASILFGVSGFEVTPYVNALYLGIVGFGIVALFVPIYLIEGNIEFPRKALALGSVVAGWALLSAAIGLLRDNPLIYIFADVAFILMGVAGYMLTRMGMVYVTIDKYSINRMFLIAWVVVGPAIIAALGLLPAPLLEHPEVLILPSLLLILVAVFAYCLLVGDLRKAIALFLPLLAGAPFVNRAMIITIVIVVVITLAVMAKQGRLRAILKASYLLALLSILFYLTGWLLADDTVSRLDETFLGYRLEKTQAVFAGEGVDVSQDIAIVQRLYELTTVADSLADSPINLVFGMGAGATIDLTYFNTLLPTEESASLLGFQEVHNIHLLPAATAYRYGLLGLGFLGVLSFWFIREAFRARSSSTFVAAMAGIGLIIYSIPASQFVFREPLLWFSLAWVVNAERSRRNEMLSSFGFSQRIAMMPRRVRQKHESVFVGSQREDRRVG